MHFQTSLNSDEDYRTKKRINIKKSLDLVTKNLFDRNEFIFIDGKRLAKLTPNL